MTCSLTLEDSLSPSCASLSGSQRGKKAYNKFCSWLKVSFYGRLSFQKSCLPFSLTSLSPVDVSFPDTEGKVSMSEGARCESSAIHIGLNKLWEGKERREKGEEGGRRRQREQKNAHINVTVLLWAYRTAIGQVVITIHGIEEVLLTRFRFFIQHNVYS